jgi:hypothetical protein
MKKCLFLAVFAAVLSFGVVVFAEDPPPVPPAPETFTEANGNVNQAVNRNFGDNIVGGSSRGNSSAIASAKDFCEANVNTNASGIGAGFATIGPDLVKSTTSGSVLSGAQAQGKNGTFIDLSGIAEQVNWANFKIDDYNFANGWGNTSGDYKGTSSSPDQWIGGSGIVKADGESTASVTSTPTSRQSNATTKDSSIGMVNFTDGKTSVYGAGGVNGQSAMDGANFSTFSNGGGWSSYNAKDGPAIAGSLSSNLATKVEVFPDKVTADSSMSSSAKITGGKCGGSPCGD